MRGLSRMAAASVLAALAASASSCKKKAPLAAGDTCVVTRVECLDAKTALVCGESGVFTQVACRGPRGCTSDGPVPSCDHSIGVKGDACAQVRGQPRALCTDDARSALLCREGALAPAFDCTKFDCHLDGPKAECEAMTAAAGYACDTEGETFCSEDERSVLRCHEGKLERHRLCHGKMGCRGGRNPACDDTIARLNDPCQMSGMVVCAEDGQSELVCRNGTFAHSRACARTGCNVTDIAQKRIDCH